MVPSRRRRKTDSSSAPCTYREGPGAASATDSTRCCSPRPRGWSRGVHDGRVGCGLLPAPVGMVPPTGTSRSGRLIAPRVCGDGPNDVPYDRRKTYCSPRPRGWPRRRQRPDARRRLLPPSAGMAPPGSPPSARIWAAPRACGDDPVHNRPPAEWAACSPRPRGMVPRSSGPLYSLRPRGWSPRRAQRHGRGRLLPAPAGMVPSSSCPGSWRSDASRTRGDGPQPRWSGAVKGLCSPRPGWSQGWPASRPAPLQVPPALPLKHSPA